MRSVTPHIIHRIKAYIIIGGAMLIIYYMVRTAFFFFADYSWIERIFGGALFIGETYILVHAFGFFLNAFRAKGTGREKKSLNLQLRDAPPVAIVVAARHEPNKVLRDTFITLMNLDYANKNIYFLDDSSDPAYIREADEIGNELGITVFRRSIRHGAKAGIVNDFIHRMEEKYVAIFDADQNPMPGFLRKTIPLLEQDEKLAFIQTPQFYTNIDSGRISRAATIQQAIFYEAICEGKNSGNAMFCCGTNVVFRKSSLLEVGGFDEENITEDFATSVKLHARGYKSLYLNSVSAFGMAPESLPEYFKQQTRWASGTISVFRKLMITFFRAPLALTPIQWWEYFLSGSYYFIGWAFFFLMVSPIMFLIFNIPSFFIHPVFYIGIFLPYFFLSLLIFYSTMISRSYPFRMVYLGTIMGMLCFPVLMKSAVFGLMNKRMTFNITIKGDTSTMPFWRLWPYHLMLSLNMIAVIFGLSRMTGSEHALAISINVFWALYHIVILSHIYFLNLAPVANIHE